MAILGAGAAGNAAAETLRQDGFTGRVVMITQEPRLPYDRPNLSKGYLSGDAGPETLPWRTPEFYRDHDIEVLLGQRVARVEVPLKTLTFADGRTLTYDALLLATGGAPRRLEIPGAQWPNVFTLRSADDADAIIGAALPASRVVVIGTGFIGMEAAAALTKRGLAVTVVGHGAVPLSRQLGPEIGGMLQQAHEEHGVAFRLGRKPVRLEGDGRVQAVVLDDGEALPADLVVVGLGVKPATEILQGVKLNADGSVSTDRQLRVTEGLYAAGDVARFPDWRMVPPSASSTGAWPGSTAASPPTIWRAAGWSLPGYRSSGVSSLISSSSMSGTRSPGMNLSSTVTWRGAIFWASMSRATG